MFIIDVRDIKKKLSTYFVFLTILCFLIRNRKDSVQKHTIAFFRLSDKWLIFSALKTYPRQFIFHQCILLKILADNNFHFFKEQNPN